MSAFTPSPWVVSDLYVDDEGFAELAIQATFQGQKCHPAAVCLQFPNMPEMQMANARLIAAAPEILEAAYAALTDADAWREQGNQDKSWAPALRLAIAKAVQS